MRSLFLASLLLAAPALVPVAAHAQTITVDHPWARATAPNAKSGGVFLTLRDEGAPDRLTGVTTPVADMAAVHRTVEENGVMKMQPAGPLPVEAGKPVELKPGGLHIMLMGLKQPLKQGSSFPITLNFEKSPPIVATVTVGAAGASGPAMDMHMHGMPAQKP